jgi:hypothetical protein
MQYTYIKMVSLHTKALEVSSVEHQGPEVVVDSLEEGLGRAREREVCKWDVSIPLISIYAILFHQSIRMFDRRWLYQV